MVLRMMMRWAERRGFKVELLEASAGEEAGIKSATFRASGENAYGLYSAEKGVHRLVRLSPFDAANRRQTSFAGVEVAPVVEGGDVEIEDEDLQIDTYRASGAGGQHVNKTDSAVRITHRPSGIVVQCQNERSQSANKATAMAMLRSKLVERAERERQAEIARERGEAQDVNFGSQIRSYVLHPYTMVKDHRTDFEVGSAERVLDGDLDGFVRAWLEANAKASRISVGRRRYWMGGSGGSPGPTAARRSSSAASARAGRWPAWRRILAASGGRRSWTRPSWTPAACGSARVRGGCGAAADGPRGRPRARRPPRPGPLAAAWHGTGPAGWLPFMRQYWRPLVLRARAEGTVGAAGTWTARPRTSSATGATASRPCGGGVRRTTSAATRDRRLRRRPRPRAAARDRAGRALDGRLVRLGEPVVAGVRRASGRGLGPARPLAAVPRRGRGDRRPGRGPRPRRAGPGRAPHVPWSHQHLAGHLRVRVTRRGRLIYEGESALAGLEQGRAP